MEHREHPNRISLKIGCSKTQWFVLSLCVLRRNAGEEGAVVVQTLTKDPMVRELTTWGEATLSFHLAGSCWSIIHKEIELGTLEMTSFFK